MEAEIFGSYLSSSIFSPNTRYFLSYLGPIVSRLDALDLRFLKKNWRNTTKKYLSPKPLQAIDLMKEIGTHRNILSMVGYWTGEDWPHYVNNGICSKIKGIFLSVGLWSNTINHITHMI